MSLPVSALAHSALAMPCELNSGTFSTADWQSTSKAAGVPSSGLAMVQSTWRCSASWPRALHHCHLAQCSVRMPMSVSVLAHSALAMPCELNSNTVSTAGWQSTSKSSGVPLPVLAMAEGTWHVQRVDLVHSATAAWHSARRAQGCRSEVGDILRTGLGLQVGRLAYRERTMPR